MAGEPESDHCPSLDILRQFDDGSLEDSEALEAHIGRCQACVSRLNGLAKSPEIRALVAADPAGNPPGGHADERRYRVIESIGRGSMGDVSIALDTQLGRQVALKTIQAVFSDPIYKGVADRFDREARITGLLEHPGIVPVYSRGRDALGRPYYAMRLIRGETLRAAVKRFHLGSPSAGSPGFRDLLSRFVVVCQAVSYAHSRGVVHRDLKPDNILIGPFGETLVADWGLAKTLADDDREGEGGGAALPPIPPAPDLTLHGKRVGTPGYMSPEAEGGDLDRIDRASDIYSLGAILSEILTGRRPGAGSSPARVAGAAALASVADRARADDPAGRYPSALELAEEVRRWLADEPVVAHPEAIIVRTSRWMRRRRTLAVSTFVALLLTAIGLGASTAYQSRVRMMIQGERDRTVRQRDLAKRHFVDLLDSVRKNVVSLISEPALQKPELADTRFRLLDAMRAEMDRSQGEILAGDDPDMMVRLANLRVDLGAGYRTQGKLAEARSEYDAGIELGRAAVRTSAGAERERAFLAYALYRRGRSAHASGDAARTDADFGESMTIWRGLDSSEHVFGRAETLAAFAAVQMDRGNRPAARGGFTTAIATLKNDMPEPEKGTTNYRHNLSGMLHNLAKLDLQDGRTTEAEASAHEATTLADALAREQPDKAAFRRWAANMRGLMGQIYHARGDLPNARRSFEESRDLLKRLAADWPSDVQVTADLLKIRAILLLIGRSDDAPRPPTH